MSKSCCGKPIAKIIKIGTFDAGIMGLEEALKNVLSSDLQNEEQIKIDLLRLVKDFGNYIAPGTESDYKDALFREYHKYTKSLQDKQNVQLRKR